MKIEICIGDITATRTQAIVNAAKSSLAGGGGVDGQIHLVAGEGLYDECMALPILDDVRCKVGDAKITGAHNLPNEYVIHTVGPVYSDLGASASRECLSACYHNSLLKAVAYGCESIAFPAIGTGIYGYPLEDATVVAIGTIIDLKRSRPEIMGSMKVVQLVCYDHHNFMVYSRVLEAYRRGWKDSIDI